MKPPDEHAENCRLRAQPATCHPQGANRLASRHAFTLVELLVTIAIIAILASLLLAGLQRGKSSAQRARCVSNLRQLGLATHLYWDDNGGTCFRCGPTNFNGGQVWWFGWLGAGPEGERAFDLSVGVLYPYLNRSEVRLCPALGYALVQFKLKADGVIFSYGYNQSLSPARPTQPLIKISQISRPADSVLFADAAQANDFQPPASPANPMLEEWYYLDDPTNYPSSSYYPHGHFRHSQKAEVDFCDGHVASENFLPGSLDPKLPAQFVGRLRPEILH